MQLSEIQNEITIANTISDSMQSESLRIPSLHGKFLNIKSQEYLIQKKLEMEMDTLVMERWMFYTGKAAPEVYKKESFELKILKTDLDIFMDSDKKIQDIKGRIEVQKQKVSMCDEMIKALNQRTFLIKNVIEDRKFISGSN
jgi:protein associated with RNAse G/E